MIETKGDKTVKTTSDWRFVLKGKVKKGDKIANSPKGLTKVDCTSDHWDYEVEDFYENEDGSKGVVMISARISCRYEPDAE